MQRIALEKLGVTDDEIAALKAYLAQYSQFENIDEEKAKLQRKLADLYEQGNQALKAARRQITQRWKQTFNFYFYYPRIQPIVIK